MIPTWQGLDGFQIFTILWFDESSNSIGRVKYFNHPACFGAYPMSAILVKPEFDIAII